MGSPFISVVISVHERKEFVERAVRSVVSQDLPRDLFEVVVVKSFIDPELEVRLTELGATVYHTDKKTYGGKIAFAASKVSGEVIAFLDDDDEFLPGKLSRIERVFSESPRLVYYHHLYRPVDSAGIDMPHYRSEWRRSMEKVGRITLNPPIKRWEFNVLLKSEPHFNMSSITVRRRVVQENLEAYATIPRQMDLLTFACALRSRGELLLDSVILTLYRLHGSNISAKPSRTPCEYVRNNVAFLKPVIESYRLLYRYIGSTSDKSLKRFVTYHLLENQLALEVLTPTLSGSRLMRSLITYYMSGSPSTFGHQIRFTLVLLLTRVSHSVGLSYFVGRRFRRRGAS